MAKDDYGEAVAERYDRGRSLLPEALESWRLAVRGYAGSIRRPLVLDLGSGTGRFSSLLAQWFDVRVIGVEPSDGMRKKALQNVRDPRVAYVGGDAEHIPVRDGVCGAAWLSNVIHHFGDLDAAAKELRRVVEAGGPVFIRGAFPDRPHDFHQFHYFPEAALVLTDFPSYEATVETFSSAGFEVDSILRVTQMQARSLHEFWKRARTRAFLTLAAISDEAFARGLMALDDAAKHEGHPQPIYDAFDLVILR